MDRALLPFAHRLQSVPQAVEQPTHRGRAHSPSLLGQRRRQFRAALARPPQRRGRVPARQRIDERLEGGQNSRLFLLDSGSSCARRPNAARRRFTSCDLAAPLADRLPRQTGGRRHQRIATVADRRRFGRCPPPATTLVQDRRDRAVLCDDGGFQLHVSPHAASMAGIYKDGNLIQRTLLRIDSSAIMSKCHPPSRRSSEAIAPIAAAAVKPTYAANTSSAQPTNMTARPPAIPG